jgi:predicted transcriptional regulator of viral defense system
MILIRFSHFVIKRVTKDDLAISKEISRSLSPLESKLILHLGWEKQPVVNIQEAMTILDRSYGHTRQVLHGLAGRHWLAPITAGNYELVPAERGEQPFPDADHLFTGSTLVTPYYFSYATWCMVDNVPRQELLAEIEVL